MEGTPKTITVCREADGWYVGIACAEVPAQPLPPTGRATGIDMGLESFATRADGEQIKNPRWYRTAEGYFALCQRRVALRKKGRKHPAKPAKLPAKPPQPTAHHQPP